MNPAIKCGHTRLADPMTLVHHPKNPNQHPQEQIDLYKDVLKYQGWRQPIRVSKLSGYVTKGHGALLTAIAMGCTEVPVEDQEYDSEAMELADVLVDNVLPKMSRLDDKGVNVALLEIKGAGVDTRLAGFEDAPMAQLVEQPAPQTVTHADLTASQGLPPAAPTASPDPEGAKELPQSGFSEFAHECPRCGFAFNDKKPS